MPRSGGAQRDAAQVAAKRGRRDDRLVAAHQFDEVSEVASTSYRTWTITPELAKSKHFPVVMRICRRVEAAWQCETQRKVEGKPQGTHSMERAVFIPEWSGAAHGVRVSITVEKLKHGPRLPPGAQRLWAAGSPAMVRAVAGVMREVQQEAGGPGEPGEPASASGDVGQSQ